MTLLLKPVHYVLSRGVSRGCCRRAHLTAHDFDGADLDVELDWTRDRGAEGVPPELEDRPSYADLLGVQYDARGAMGTWHLESECPHVATAETREAELRRLMDLAVARKSATTP